MPLCKSPDHFTFSAADVQKMFEIRRKHCSHLIQADVHVFVLSFCQLVLTSVFQTLMRSNQTNSPAPGIFPVPKPLEILMGPFI